MDQSSHDGGPKPEALGSLQRYLLDNIPPMIFTQAVDDLFRIPVRATAAEILSWVSTQSHVGEAVKTSDYLFHAFKKLHLLGELELVPRDRLGAFLGALKPYLLQACPDHERAALARSLEQVGHSEELSSPVSVVHRAAGVGVAVGGGGGGGGGGVPIGVAGAGSLLSDPRIELLLRALQGQLARTTADAGAGVAGAPVAAPGSALAGLLTELAAAATSASHLEGGLAQLGRYGVPAVSDGIVRLLGQSLPDWAAPQLEEGAAEPPQRAVRAMHKMIGMADGQKERYQRFGELVGTATEQFNAGSLGRAVTMFDLAGRMIEKNEVDTAIVTSVRDKAFAELDEKQLRSCADNPDTHVLFRRVMAFFPQFAPTELFIRLEDEQNRDRRRLILQLLAAQGAPARAAVLDALHRVLTGERSYPWYVERNLVYLLRTLPRPEDAPLDVEVDVLTHLSEFGNPLPLIREALATLGQLQHERVVRTLVARISELEEGLLGERQLPHSREENLSLLDTAVTMLARTGTPEARRSLVAHGLKRQPQLGNTVARLSRLGNQDLSDDPTLVKRLLQTLREELPSRLLGVTVGARRRAEGVERLIEALASTDLPQVRAALHEVVDRFPTQPFSATATRILERMGAPRPAEVPPTAALAGDLGLFGFPGVLQNLSDSQVTGVLTVLDASGTSVATIRLDGGLIRTARCGRLVGEAAVYQMLERPVAGRFIFVDNNEESVVNLERGAPQPVQPLLFEGIRRYDELMRAVTVAPDDARYQATDRKPTRLPDEADTDLLKAVWYRAAGGASPAECEAEQAVDVYRVRRMLEHWVTEGALAPR